MGEEVAMDLQEATTVAYNIVTSTAVVIGGVWAYFKFVRGRTFANRAELSVSARFDGSPGQEYLCATIALKNTGLSKLPLNAKMKAVRIFGVADASTGTGEAKWERIITLPVLEQHEWLEAQETVTDIIVYRVPLTSQTDTHHGAYQLEAIVGARPRPITRRRIQWQARTVAFLADHSGSSKDLPILVNSSRKGNLIQRFINRDRINDYGR